MTLRSALLQTRHFDATVVGEVGDRFESLWQPQQSPDEINRYLPPANDPAHVPLLVELACRDLERRLQAGQAVRAEDYLERFPVLARDPTAAVAVIATEFQQRRNREPDLTAASVLQRFPHLHAELEEHLQARPLVPGYEILGVLGRGGMGVVYKARQVSLNRVVALKTILAGAHSGAEERARFQAEARAVASLQHPNIVQIFEVGEHNGLPFLALEYVEGGSLAEKLGGTPQPAAVAARIVETLARAMHCAHQAGILHRDLKPANVLLSACRFAFTASDAANAKRQAEAHDEFVPKITDFGLAKKLDGAPGLTSTGAIMGTPSYMAPEQASGVTRRLGPSADVYALGAILYEMLVGRPPFLADTQMETILQVIAQEPVPVRRLQPCCPRDLETICHKCLEKDPKRRYSTALELADDLQRFQQGQPILARPVGWVERGWRWSRRHPAGAGLILAAALLLVALVVGGVQRQMAISARADAETARAEAATRSEEIAQEKARRAEAETARLRAETLPLLERATMARAERFHQGEAVYLARALEHNDQPALRARWLEALQRSLVPVATSSRRCAAGVLLYSSDGRTLVSGDRAGPAIRIWRISDGVQSAVLRGHSHSDEIGPQFNTITGLAFRPDRPHELVSVGVDGRLLVWDTRTAALIGTARRSASPLLGVAIEPGQGRYLLTGDSKGKMAWWDAQRLEPLHEVPAAHKAAVSRVCYRPDGLQCASAGHEGVVRLWEPSQGKPLAELTSPAGTRSPLLDLAYSPDGRQLAAGASVGHVYIWDVSTGKLVHQLRAWEEGSKPEQPVVRALVYVSPRRLFAAGRDGVIRAWDTTTGNRIPLPGCRHQANVFGLADVRGLAVAPGGAQVASCSTGDLSIRVWDNLSGQLLASLEGGNLIERPGWSFRSSASAYCPGKHLLITATPGGVDAFLRSHDTRTLRERRTYTAFPATTTLPHRDRVSALAIDPSGQRFVSSEPDGRLLWWDSGSGKLLLAGPPAHRPLDPDEVAPWIHNPNLLAQVRQGSFSWLTVRALAWQHDGKQVASAGLDGILKLWDPQTGKQLAAWPNESAKAKRDDPTSHVTRLLGALAGHRAVPHYCLLFDPRRPRLVTAGGDPVIRLWSLETRQVVARLRAHNRRVDSLAVSDDGQLLASGSEDGLVVIWDLETLVPRRTIPVRPLQAPDLSLDPVVRDERLRELHERQARTEAACVRGLAFSPDGQWLAVVLRDGSISLLDVQTGEVACRGIGHETDGAGRSEVTPYFTREGELVTVGGDETIRHWDLPAWSTGRRLWAPSVSSPPAWRYTGRSGWSVVAGASVVRWIESLGRFQIEWDGSGDSAGAMAADRADGKLVLATDSGRVLVLDVRTGQMSAEFKRPASQRSTSAVVAVQRDGNLAASSSVDGSVDLWRIGDGRHVRTLTIGPGRVYALAFRPDGRQLAVAYDTGRVHVHDVASGKLQISNIVGPANPQALCYSPDGWHLVQAGDGGSVFIWDAATGQRRNVLAGHRTTWQGLSREPARALDVPDPERDRLAQVAAAVYRPDGKWLATGGADGSIRLWDAQHDYRPLTVLSTLQLRSDSSREICTHLTFTPDGRQLIAVTISGAVRVYDLAPIEAELKWPSAELLAQTERWTGLRLQGERLVAVQTNQLVRPGESLRPAFHQVQNDALARLFRIDRSLTRQGRLVEARQQLESFLAEGGLPDVVSELAHNALANVCILLGDLDRAETEARAALAANPSNMQARVILLPGICRERGDFAQAIALHRETLAAAGLLQAAEREARVNLALIYLRQGDLAQAGIEVCRALVKFPEYGLARNVLGEVYLQLGQPERAAAVLRQNLAEAPDDFLCRSFLLRVYQQMRAIGPARQLYAESVKRTASPAVLQPMQRTLVLLYLDVGALDEAEKLLDGLGAIAKDDPLVLSGRAYLDAVRGKRLDHARAAIDRLLRTLPENRSLQLIQAVILARQGEVKRALAILEKHAPAAVANREVTLLDHLGDLYVQAGRSADAHRVWEIALRLFPGTVDPGDRRHSAIVSKLRSLADDR
jgi:WD40 repeat protein/tetratricopeptide (TPR) repeat protein/tRNA A-37 threonylcarbamoyl transferase component Bud32